MDHVAPAQLPIADLLARRWSPVAFTLRMLTEQEAQMLLEAARWAPSSFNEQPWRFVYALKDDGEPRAQLESLLNDGNAWAKAAPFLALIVGKKAFSRNGKPNRHYAFDCGSAMENLFLQATAMGLQGHGMAGFDLEKARALYALPENCEPLTMIAVGEHDAADTRDAAVKERENAPRVRTSLDQIAFRGVFKAS